MHNMDVVMPILGAFACSMVLCPIIIPFLRKLNCGQQIRQEGPKSHFKKAGTPTMGGLIILLATVFPSMHYIQKYPQSLAVLFVTVGFGIIGLLDDYIKIVMHRSLGLCVWQKLLLQVLVSGVFVWYCLDGMKLGTDILIPYTGGIRSGEYLTLPVTLYVLLAFFAILGTVNGANFTDGLDGLAAGVTLLIAVFFTVLSIVAHGSSGPLTASVVGALMGFLVFNTYPARVFMGDTGSLALGGFVAATAILMKLPLLLPIVGIIYLAEVVSVILQVGYFRWTRGKRLFRMAPVHHHLEQCGWCENRVVTVFSMITAIFCLVALLGLV